MRISDWSSDVCSSDLAAQPDFGYRNLARWDETLDSDRARCMEEQMAPEMTQAQMTPPEAAPAFLDSAGWGDARILPLAGDASFRRYFRVIDNERQAVLMEDRKSTRLNSRH